MHMPDRLKPAMDASATSATVLGLVGFTWGGWVTGQTAQDRAMAMSHDDVVEAMGRYASTWQTATRTGWRFLQRHPPQQPTDGGIP